ncbi:hypothetical protein CU669_12355 [Paramagnetospirillum kuznetsovii]|uniref:DUF6969 domain-containing protein n=2 Tax=Paramagnetospirillum kuznetsovii TaxID=2053833 RepID=A0A364NWN1_9PROT|nr:hypothetical protein [Paramagnetospirillum kuznetsovii]RAU21488.1 hypothetical protein CU669_12355 [Paramagnetospirillum kuznetsovii]
MLALWRAMADSGASPVSLLLGGVSQPSPHRHFPVGDVYDFTSHAQFYYHVHRDGECGHIHLFQRSRGMPPGVVPLLPSREVNAPCHLMAVGLGPSGDATELFTTNRWVTGEAWYDAHAVKAMLPLFKVAARGDCQPVAAWLEALVSFYAPSIARLAEERDATVAAWRQSHPGIDPLDDSRLEITSRLSIDPRGDVLKGEVEA